MFPEGKTCPLACFEHRLDTPCVSGAGDATGRWENTVLKMLIHFQNL